MFNRIVLGLMLAELSLGVQIQSPFGTEVRVKLKTGLEYNGEILALRDSCIVVSSLIGASDDELARSKNTLSLLRHYSIHEISLPSTGSSQALLGALLGASAGCLTGFAMGGAKEVERKRDDTFGCRENEEKQTNQVNGGLIGCAVGALLGAGVGSAFSTKDVLLISPTKRHFAGLRIVARYQGDEPDFLREIK